MIKVIPQYTTICISLWDLTYSFPEYDFANDLATGLNDLTKASTELDAFQNKNHSKMNLLMNNGCIRLGSIAS